MNEKEIIEEGAKKFKVDKRVYKAIALFPLKFVKRKIESLEDWKPIRVRYFGVFDLTKTARDKINSNTDEHQDKPKNSEPTGQGR